MDATAVAIVNEELSYSDPGFCLAYLAHAQLMVNNLAFNGDPKDQKGQDPSPRLQRAVDRLHGHERAGVRNRRPWA